MCVCVCVCVCVDCTNTKGIYIIYENKNHSYVCTIAPWGRLRCVCMCVWIAQTQSIYIIYIEIETGAYTKCAFGMLVVGDVGRAVVIQD